VKGHDVAVRALPALRGAQVTVCGEEATPNDAHVRANLAKLAVDLGLEGRVHLLDAIPRSEVPRLFAEADVLVNATHGASADKVVFEALAACTAVVASSPVFDGLLPPELRFTDGDPAGLAAAVRAAVALPEDERRRLRARVAAEHSVEHWADNVLAAAAR
jgi:glycosyltransferase involved in cell wall biosynthesis